MEKINVAELLKDCPKGMELDCTTYDSCTLEIVFEGCLYPIQIRTPEGLICLTKYGRMSQSAHSKCVIFPKGKTTWEGFVPPCQFKDGDILYVDCTEENDHKQYDYIFILNKIYNGKVHSYCHYYIPKDDFKREYGIEYLTDDKYPIRLATEEEKQKLFDAIKENGYRWNAETKTLEKLPKFKDGDIVVDDIFPFIYKDCDNTEIAKSYCGIDSKGNFWKASDKWAILDKVTFATEEQKEKLFKAIKENGYHWNANTKVLEKLITPNFKKGDKVRVKGGVCEPRIIGDVCDTFYTLVPIGKIDFTDQDNWELVPNKFDINTLKPFESRVLVRDNDFDSWKPSFWGYLRKGEFMYDTIRGVFRQCIPYKGNEYLRGKRIDCDDFYKIWEK